MDQVNLKPGEGLMSQHSRRGRAPCIHFGTPPPTGMEWTGYRLPGIPSLGLTELGPIQKFSCWMYFTLSYTPLFFSTYQGGQEEPEP